MGSNPDCGKLVLSVGFFFSSSYSISLYLPTVCTLSLTMRVGKCFSMFYEKDKNDGKSPAAPYEAIMDV